MAEATPKSSPQHTTRSSGRWFAPPAGGYSGHGPNGEIVRRTGFPPKIPATPSGVQRQQKQKQSEAES
jgi:hypothetical protein